MVSVKGQVKRDCWIEKAMEPIRGKYHRLSARHISQFLWIQCVADFTVTEGVNASRETSVGQKDKIGIDLALIPVYPVTPGGPLVTKGAISLPSWSVDFRSGDRAETRRTTSHGFGSPN